jgi:hypothetical protein
MRLATALGRPALGTGRGGVGFRSRPPQPGGPGFPSRPPQPGEISLTPRPPQSLVEGQGRWGISSSGIFLRRIIPLHWRRRGYRFVAAEVGSAWAGEGGPGRHPSTGPRAASPPVLSPTLTLAKEVILVKSKYSVQPGTGKRSLGRHPKPKQPIRLFAPAGVRAGLRQMTEAPPEACRWRFSLPPPASPLSRSTSGRFRAST